MTRQEIDAEELFNLSLSILGLVMREGPMKITELEKHFGFSADSIRKAVIAIADSEDLDRYLTHFYLDHDAFEAGEVSFSNAGSDLDEAPTLSARQITALATGLDFLAALPEFFENPELTQLRRALSVGTSSITSLTTSEALEHLSIIRQALSEGFQLRCEYQNQVGERSARQIDPLRIDFVGRNHYLRGWCHKNNQVRSFRVDRMISLSMTNEAISDQGKLAQIPDEVFGTEDGQTAVHLAARPEAAEIFWNFPTESKPALVDGELVGTILIGNLESLGRHVTRYGGDVRVMAPASARAAVAAFAQAALKPEGPGDED